MKSSRFVLLLTCGLMSCLTAGLWLNNVYLSWIEHVWMKDESFASTISGLFPLFDSVCIDHSTVSTFIPFFSLIWLTAAFYRLDRWAKTNKPKNLKKEFPYFSGYNEWMVALGLMGTVWGLIMIGYLPNLDNLKIADLIGALHTALFSTLIALIWVYIIVQRIIGPFMQLYAAKYIALPPRPATYASLEAAMNMLGQNLGKLNQVLVQSTEILDELRKKVTIEKLEEADKFFKACAEALPIIEASCQQQPLMLQGIKELMDRQVKLSGDHSDHLETIENLLNRKHERDKRKRQGFREILKVCLKYSKDAVR